MKALLLILIGVFPAEAAVLCARPKSDQTLNTAVKVREVCKANEVQLGIVSLNPLEVGNQATISTTTTTIASTTSIVSPSSTSTSSVPSTTTTTTSLANRWVDNGDGTVSDLITGLMWEKLSNDGSLHDQDNSYFYGQGTEKIDLLNATLYAGYSDWRFPSRVELETILDLTVGPPGPTVPSAFNQACTFACSVLTCSCTRSHFYWSSTAYAGTTYVWIVSFNDGSVTLGAAGSPYYVRGIRGGPPL